MIKPTLTDKQNDVLNTYFDSKDMDEVAQKLNLSRNALNRRAMGLLAKFRKANPSIYIKDIREIKKGLLND